MLFHDKAKFEAKYIQADLLSADTTAGTKLASLKGHSGRDPHVCRAAPVAVGHAGPSGVRGRGVL